MARPARASSLLIALALAGCASTPREVATLDRGDPGSPAADAIDGECTADTDCEPGEACVEDCGAAWVGGVGVAQAIACPRVCRRVAPQDRDVATPPEPAPPVPAAEPTPAAPPTGTPDPRRLPPVEETTAGDGKLLAALDDAAALLHELRAAVTAEAGCAARVARYAAWTETHRARASRLAFRVRFLAARRFQRLSDAERAAVARHEAAYERLTGAFLAVCDEAGPELAALGEMEGADIPPTFHRTPVGDDSPLRLAACVRWREIRDRALVDPWTLVGERVTYVHAESAVALPQARCEVDWPRDGDRTVTCVDEPGVAERMDARRVLVISHGMRWIPYRTKLAVACMGAEGEPVTASEADGVATVTSADPRYRVVAGPSPEHGGRFVWTFVIPR